MLCLSSRPDKHEKRPETGSGHQFAEVLGCKAEWLILPPSLYADLDRMKGQNGLRVPDTKMHFNGLKQAEEVQAVLADLAAFDPRDGHEISRRSQPAFLPKACERQFSVPPV